MKKTLTKSFMQIALGHVCAALTLTAALFTVSCEQPTNSERSESIEVYVDLDEKEPVDVASVRVVGGLHQLYVKSNVAFTASWEDGETTPWATVVDDTAVDPKTGYRIVTLDVKRRHNTLSYYTRRTGTLILQANNESLNFSKYIQVHQGSLARISSDFAWMTYATNDPRLNDGVILSSWSTTLKDRGYRSTPNLHDGKAHLYGKKGYLQLGDAEGHGADMISPYTSDFRYDSLLMVSFRAVAHTNHVDGAKDGNKFTVEVTGGGVIADFAESNTTSIELEAPHFDPQSVEFPTDMWTGSDFLVFVVGTEDNPLTVNTTITIKSGSLDTPTTTPNRIYVDNFYVRRVLEGEEPYFEENGGSGADKILGLIPEEVVE